MSVLAVVAAFLALLTTACAGPDVDAVGRDPQWGWTQQAAPLQLGVTHTQDDLERTAAYPRALDVLRGAGTWQDQHLMGFGTLNPEPSPGRYDWSTLDNRMAIIRASGGSTVLTAAVAPDWMKGGQPGTTDWSTIEVAPRPEFYDAFADLTARAVARYPQIRAVLVWNELKGFFDAQTNNWDAAGYTDLYNRVYRAVKQVRPTVLVGGPYIPLDAFSTPTAGGVPSAVRGPWGVTDQRSLDVVTYWLAHKAGADLVAVDGGSGTKDAGLVTDPGTGVDRFETLSRWVRARTDLPVWWAEFYPEPAASSPASGPTSPERAVVTLDAVAAMARGGAATALLWAPEAGPDLPYAALWTDTADPDGGRPTPLTAPWTWLAPRLAVGNVQIGRSPDGRVLAFRAPDGLLAVNTSPDAVTAGGSGFDLAGYETAIY